MTALADWAESGVLALTGRADGPPLIPPGRAASWAREQLAGLSLSIPGVLAERAAYAGLRRNGPRSCGGTLRILPTSDGHVALSLARPEDTSLLPALTSEQDLDRWAATTTTATASERMELLGLPGGAVPTPEPGEAVSWTVLGERVRRERVRRERPVVLDLTALWAGPLCAHLLGLRGARVVKVESSTRPDGARRGPRGFFDLLHRGHEQRVLDLRRDLGQLAAWIAEADLVLESSRPRALRQLGIFAEAFVAAGTSWLSITARGRSSDAVGFGDDVAARAGLTVADGELLPVGDALADPLAGIAAAAAGSAALASSESRLIEVSMLGVAASVAGPLPEGRVVRSGSSWWAEDEHGRYPVRSPRERRCC